MLTGALSDAIGLQTSLAWILPVSVVLAVLGTFAASRTITADHNRALLQETA